ncbi:LMBR1 domain-containing protein [Bacillus inaquosorum]|uniref:LMBR1 domain-containing protein n=1 Tax=Bacillus inaquosorum TaxID=483913 RepID=UPI00227DF1FF|nr:LMBR1 domain-containing protein [Bacillus inaquosorum]MCY9175603.1 LMBR1 domain-containing protein [Bacillus inaquosorum]
MEMALAFLGFLACLISLGYGLYHLVRYVLKKEKRFSKRLFWPLFIGGLVLLFTGAGLSEPDAAAATAEKKYSALNAEYKSLTKEHEELEKEYKSVSSEAKKLKDNTEDQGKLEQLEKENSELKKTQKSLKAEMKELQENQKQLKEDTKTVKAENETLKQDKTKLEKQLKEAKSQTASSHENTAGNSSSNTNKSDEAKTADTAEGCNIKGSKNGIYHTPGSTYYDRTTDPAEMFCSVEEAEAAGYRAPKR